MGASSSHSHPPDQDQQNTGLGALEAERQRRNVRQRERRQSMSSSQRAENLARRRANYQLRRQMRNRTVENTSMENELEPMAGVEDQDNHQTTPSNERERRRTGWRTSQRIWRASMSSEARDGYLARRRANYHDQRFRSHDTTFTRQTSNHGDIIQVPNRMRLSHIRQLARSNRSQGFHNGVEQNSANNGDNVVVNQGISENFQNNMQYNSGIPQGGPRARGCGPHNCARNFHEIIGVTKLHLPAPTTCPHCRARLFHHKTKDMCCLNGKTALPLVQSPPEMIELFTAETPQGTHCRQNIRAYNHVFSFTSMGVHADQNLATGGATFTFRAQGSIYHKIGSLLPDGNNRPRFLQLYIYDRDYEVENRMLENDALHRDVVENIQQILNRHNPFVQTFHHLAQRQDMQNCRLIIREQVANQRQYTLPSTSQVAAIIVGADDA